MIESSAVEVQQFVPTVYLYDNFPGGVGLSEPLWQRQAELVQRARELVDRCDCVAGCPACVGPVLATQRRQAIGDTEIAGAGGAWPVGKWNRCVMPVGAT